MANIKDFYVSGESNIHEVSELVFKITSYMKSNNVTYICSYADVDDEDMNILLISGTKDMDKIKKLIKESIIKNSRFSRPLNELDDDELEELNQIYSDRRKKKFF